MECRTRTAEDWIIPARAGFTVQLGRGDDGGWDHPRSRGVYDQAWDDTMDGWGSSPLARGLLADSYGLIPEKGIIPARAGFTMRGQSLPEPVPDHPRSRGVYKPK